MVKLFHKRQGVELKMWKNIRTMDAKKDHLVDILTKAHSERLRSIAAIQGNNSDFLTK
jgi:hypothetical protein